MTDKQLTTPYRNLLVVLAREIGYLQDSINEIKAESLKEKSRGRAVGLSTIAKTKANHRDKIILLLGRNKAACRHFFKTGDPKLIAQQEITLQESEASTHN